MTNPTLPNADELEVVALLKERDGQTFDGEVHLSSVEAAAITAQIERLTRERDEALEQIGAINERALDDVSNLTMRAEAAEAEVKRVSAERDALIEALTPSAGTKGAYIGEFGMPVVYRNDDGEEATAQVSIPWTTIKEIMEFIRTRALSGGTSNG
jgi:hypothetical protein